VAIHDSGYKRLFANRTIFRQLIETFIEEEWVQELDFDRCQRIEKSFVAEHYKETESDLIYQVPFRNRAGAMYIYMLIEFQSTVPRFMAVRVLDYIANFYLDYLIAHEKVDKLPPVFPMVLYNGDRRWTAPLSIADLIEGYPPLGKHGLNFEYFKLAENEYGRETLLAIRNIVSTLFLAEAHYDVNLLLEELVKLYDTETDKDAVSLFLNWFKQLAVHGYIRPADYGALETVYYSREEVKSMLVTALEREKQAILEEVKSMLVTALEREKQTILEEGIGIGETRGIEIGETRGIQIGKEQRDRQIVQAMHQKGFDSTIIAEVTGRSVEEIKRILEADGSSVQPRDSVGAP
jgi:predicted transposase/invertase (TIGR01784 family)